MAKNRQYFIRKTHRYLGVILGVQFLFWTIGGLYFSWSDMDEIHGDHHKAIVSPLESDIKMVNPQDIIQKIKKRDSIKYILDIRLIQILDQPVYQIIYKGEENDDKKIQLAQANTGELRNALSKEEAIKVAQKSFYTDAMVSQVEYLTNTSKHHEYRENPLPAFAVKFEHPSNTTVYVSSELGTVQKFRNDKWRIFDFLWMMHTMDYQGRDNITNWLLRAFSIFGLMTIASGFVLFFVSCKKVKISQ